MSAEQPRRAASFASRSKRWAPPAGRSEPKGSQNAQRNYERYLALAGAAALSGDTVGAENYYQHAEHFFRSMSSDQVAVRPCPSRTSAASKCSLRRQRNPTKSRRRPYSGDGRCGSVQSQRRISMSKGNDKKP